MSEDLLYDEQKKLVLIRFKTLNPESKIMSGGTEQISVSALIQHVESDDQMGKDIITAQIKMLQVLANVE